MGRKCAVRSLFEVYDRQKPHDTISHGYTSRGEIGISRPARWYARTWNGYDIELSSSRLMA
jgi:hypothetical protein